MKNRKKNRILLLLILLLAVTIGFALLSTTLKINGISGIKKNTWDIHWNEESIVETSGSVTATTPAYVSDTAKKIITFDVSLELPGEFYEFMADAKNYGSVAGKVEDVKIKLYEADGVTLIDPEDVSDYLVYSFTHSDGSEVEAGEVIKPTESKTYKFRVGIKGDQLPPSNGDIKFTIEVDFGQTKVENVEYKDYDILEEVYYNPVSNKWCDYYNYTTDGLCDRWLVLDKDDENNKLTLVYAEVNNNYAVTMNDKEAQIDSITANWSDKLKITKKGQVSSTWSISGDSVSYDFTGKKARFLLGSEITSDLLAIFGLHQEILENNIYYIDDTASPVANGIIIRNGATSSSTINAGPIDSTPQVVFNPVIEVTKGRKDLKDAVVKPAYLDPANLSKKCTQKEVEDNVNSHGTPTEITEGCMKWYIYGENGNKYKLILDHNTVSAAYHPLYIHNGDAVGQYKLDELTNTYHWQATPRLITADELANITRNGNFDSQVTISNYGDPNDGHFFFEVNSVYQPSKYIKRYAWLVNYLKDSRSYGAKYEDSNTYNYFSLDAYYGSPSNAITGKVTGYMTSSNIAQTDGRYIWSVYYEGRYYDQMYSQCINGIRPVIEIDKSIVD